MGKRAIGTLALLMGRARRFRLERLDSVLERVVASKPDHVLITGDLTTLSLPSEFEAARAALEPVLSDSARVTILPGNHDRYTRDATRRRLFEKAFGDFMGSGTYPSLRSIGGSCEILALDAARPFINATGRLPEEQLERASALVSSSTAARLIVACHYPLEALASQRVRLARKRMTNAGAVAARLRTIGPHLYCCGHVHSAWAIQPTAIPNQLCLNAGAPLLCSREPGNDPGFLAIELEGSGVRVEHHAWRECRWEVRTLAERALFFPRADQARVAR